MNRSRRWQMANKIKYRVFFWVLFVISAAAYGQEALLSYTEQYYDFLALQGLTERPHLNYRTLSDSVWTVNEGAEHLWKNQNLGTKRQLSGKFFMRIYGPELFTSVNTAVPYGQNDGVLWQGKGFNASLTGGVRFEGFGVEATFKPQLAFSQNLAFDYISPHAAYLGYTDKAAVYGYYGVPSIDAPQRFGDKPFFDYSWGDSEIRYTWKTLTAGFGTQPVWLGPAQINSIIHSNNAASYPKLDIGLRRQPINLPWLNWYIGDIEIRAWWGYLSESDYFDNDSANDHNLITGFSLAYSFPWLLKGFTIGMNRIMLSKWDSIDSYSLFNIFLPNFIGHSSGSDENDQRASITFDYLFPRSGLDIYFEWARNDYSPTLDLFIRYPFHTEAYTFGIKKSLNFTKHFHGEILLEISKLEGSQDYDRIINWSTTFYAHHDIKQGHTNQGQWLGAGIGTGGNSQYLGFKLYFPRGYGQLFFQRRNPDLDYTWYIDSKKYPPSGDTNSIAESNIRTFFDFGTSGLFWITQDLSLSGSIVFRDEHNPLNKSMLDRFLSDSLHRYNVYFSLGIKYSF
jgi:hypothetical protein